MSERRPFSLNDGGPFFRLMRRLRIVRPGRMVRAWIPALFAWAPLALGELVQLALGHRLDPTMFDIAVHVRLLFALPMILVAEWLTEPAARSAIHSLYAGQLCDERALDAIVARGERLRDAWWPEAILLVLALVGGQLALWHLTGATGVFHGGTAVTWSLPHAWYVAVALPLAQFVMYRWLWRWAIWSYMLVRIAAQPLAVIATHPDGAAGLGCVARPLSGFTGFALAVASVLACAGGTQILAGQTTLKGQLPELLVFVAVVVSVAVAPLLLYSAHLYRVRRRTIAQYSDFATEYTQEFHAKWIEHSTPGRKPLGTPDLQSFNDLIGTYRSAAGTRAFVFGLRQLSSLCLAVIIPMLPLFATLVTVEDVLKRIFTTLVGGFPL